MTADNGQAPVAFLPQSAHGLSGRLGFAAAPGRWRAGDPLEAGRWLDCDLAALRARGTSVLVTLLEDEEMARLGVAQLVERARRVGLETRRFPIPDHCAPSDLRCTAELVRAILEDLAAGRTVVVHCRGGIGRSGTIAACCLVAAGAEPRLALALVREARARAAPGLDGFVDAFARAWARTTAPGGLQRCVFTPR